VCSQLIVHPYLGTLTKNEQTVTEIYSVDEVLAIDASTSASNLSNAKVKTLEIGSICNNAIYRAEEGVYVGHSVDVALLNVLGTFGMSDFRQVCTTYFLFSMNSSLNGTQSFTRHSELSFNSERKYMAVSGTHSLGNLAVNGASREMYYIKGSIDAILERCKFYYVSDGSTPGLDANTRNVILSKAQLTASRGLRVIAMAYGYGAVESSAPSSAAPSRSGTPGLVLDKEKTNLVFVGFQAMFDPPRKGVADAINLLQTGGVHVVMITGDAEETAMSIAQQLGLRLGAGSKSCLTGREIDQLTQAQLRERVGSVSVFARTTPKHKMAIVGAFQSRGAVVAMTGDGGLSLSSLFGARLFDFSVFWFQSTMRLRSKWPISECRWARVGRM
jgi:P-type Ca2+ transporter type 2C